MSQNYFCNFIIQNTSLPGMSYKNHELLLPDSDGPDIYRNRDQYILYMNIMFTAFKKLTFNSPKRAKKISG